MSKVSIHVTSMMGKTKVIDIDIPSEWKDLSPVQFATCARLFTERMADDEFISLFFGISPKLAARLTAFEKFRLIDLVSFVSGARTKVNFFYMRSIPGTSLLSPLPRLSNVSLRHFALFDTYFFEYTNKPDTDGLVRLVSALYLAKGEHINRIDFQKRMDYVRRTVDISTLYAIFLNYTFIRRWLSGPFSYLFTFRDDDEEDSPKKVSRQPKANLPDWNAIIDGLVGDDVLNYDKYANLPCIRAFKVINKRISDYKKHGTKLNR